MQDHWLLILIGGGLAVIGLVVLAIVRKQWGWGLLAFWVLVAVGIYGTIGSFRSQHAAYNNAWDTIGTQEARHAHSALLGFPTESCLSITHSTMERTAANMRYVRVRERTCPGEIGFEISYATSWQRLASKDVVEVAPYADSVGVFAPTELGDTILLFVLENYPPEWKRIYANLDTTEIIAVGEVD